MALKFYLGWKTKTDFVESKGATWIDQACIPPTLFWCGAVKVKVPTLEKKLCVTLHWLVMLSAVAEQLVTCTCGRCYWDAQTIFSGRLWSVVGPTSKPKQELFSPWVQGSFKRSNCEHVFIIVPGCFEGYLILKTHFLFLWKQNSSIPFQPCIFNQGVTIFLRGHVPILNKTPEKYFEELGFEASRQWDGATPLGTLPCSWRRRSGPGLARGRRSQVASLQRKCQLLNVSWPHAWTAAATLADTSGNLHAPPSSPSQDQCLLFPESPGLFSNNGAASQRRKERPVFSSHVPSKDSPVDSELAYILRLHVHIGHAVVTAQWLDSAVDIGSQRTETWCPPADLSLPRDFRKFLPFPSSSKIHFLCLLFLYPTKFWSL